MLGSHTGGWVGSLQPSIHNHLSAATNIAAKANVGGTAEKNHLVMLQLEIHNVTYPLKVPWSTHTRNRLYYHPNLLER